MDARREHTKFIKIHIKMMKMKEKNLKKKFIINFCIFMWTAKCMLLRAKKQWAESWVSANGATSERASERASAW